MNQFKNSQAMVDHYEALKGDHTPVADVINRADYKRFLDESNTAYRLRNRGKIIAGLGGAVAAGLVGVAAANGLMDEAGDHQRLVSNEQSNMAQNIEVQQDPGDPVEIDVRHP